MSARRDQQQLIEAARLYYLEGLDQSQVGKRLQLSRSTVSRMLAEARESGIVQITIVGAHHVDRNRELEAALMSAFSLSEALVCETQAPAATLRSVAQLGVQTFTHRAPRANRIGFSWGTTVGALIDELPDLSLPSQTRLVPLVGGMPTLDTAPSGNTNMEVVATKCGVTAEHFYAPAVVESALTQQAMMRESSVQDALQRAASCELAFVGIGGFNYRTSKRVLDAMRLTEAERAAVVAAEPTGDMLGRYFDIQGRPLGAPTADRVIGLDLDALAQIDVVVGLAAGKEKASGVLGALRHGALDLVIVDEQLAAATLALNARVPARGQRSAQAS